MSAPALSEAQRLLLREIPARIPVERIERVWLFSPREVGGRESGLVVLSLLPGAERPGGQRQVVTWRYEAERTRRGPRRTDSVSEEGWAPAERIPRLIEGVLARLGDETESPVADVVEGSRARWEALLERLGAATVDSPAGE